MPPTEVPAMPPLPSGFVASAGSSPEQAQATKPNATAQSAFALIVVWYLFVTIASVFFETCLSL
ncbi:MAG: hypothetical protein HS104_16535 [Polyangiaceae bacterium]|nr:hypothetical protein [Polyangiaceae bacterium]